MVSCQQCGKDLGEPGKASHQPTRRFCGARCRAKSWREGRERRGEEVAEALEVARKALERAREAAVSRKKKGDRP